MLTSSLQNGSLIPVDSFKEHGVLGLPHMIPFAKSFASSWAIASCQVSGTETPWRKNGFWIVLFFLLRQNRFEQKIVTDQGQQLWFSDGPGWSRFLHHRTEVQKTKKGSKHHRFTSRKSRVYITIYIIYQRGVWDVFFFYIMKSRVR